MLDVVEVLLRELDALERRLRRGDDFFVALAIRGEQNVAGHAVFAVGAAVEVDGLDDEGLRVGVVVALFFEFEFAVAEFFDDLIDGDVGWLGGDFGGLVG